MSYFVYALTDPRTDEIRYIGKSANPAQRLASHASRSGAVAVRNWIKSVGAPGMRILGEFANETFALVEEQTWIRKLHATGRLLNSIVALDDIEPNTQRFTGFGGRCVARRKQLCMTQVRLAKAIGVLPPTLSRIESSERPGLSAETAVRIAQFLRCSVEWLVTGEERASESQAAE